MSTGNEFLAGLKRNTNESIITFLTPAVHDFHGGFHDYPSSVSHPPPLFHNRGGIYEYQDVSEGSSCKHMEKKRRLTNHQVKHLERYFEMDSKLDLERKNQLAQDLGLQSRQVAIWFQNRRARCKTKQLERDYNHLKGLYDAAFSEKQKLEAQVLRLKEMLQMRAGCRTEENKPSEVPPINDVQETFINRNEGPINDSKISVIPIEASTMQEKVQETEFSCNRTEHSELLNADSSNEEEDIAHVLVKETRMENLELIIKNAYLHMKMDEGHNSHHPQLPPLSSNGFPAQYEDQTAGIGNLEWSYGLWQYDPSSLFV